MVGYVCAWGEGVYANSIFDFDFDKFRDTPKVDDARVLRFVLSLTTRCNALLEHVQSTLDVRNAKRQNPSCYFARLQDEECERQKEW